MTVSKKIVQSISKKALLMFITKVNLSLRVLSVRHFFTINYWLYIIDAAGSDLQYNQSQSV